MPIGGPSPTPIDSVASAPAGQPGRARPRRHKGRRADRPMRDPRRGSNSRRRDGPGWGLWGRWTGTAPAGIGGDGRQTLTFDEVPRSSIGRTAA